MNCYAYPVIFDSIKSENNNYLAVHLYDSILFIYKKHNKIHLKEPEKETIYDIDSFNFFTNKPINKITILCDKYGTVFNDIFVKKYYKAASVIQNEWKIRKFKTLDMKKK